jgi:hypothetical protein
VVMTTRQRFKFQVVAAAAADSFQAKTWIASIKRQWASLEMPSSYQPH